MSQFNGTFFLSVYRFFELRRYKAVIVNFMRYDAPCAVFHTFPGEPEITSAAVPEKIQRTITEQTVEIVRIGPLVTGEIYAVPV